MAIDWEDVGVFGVDLKKSPAAVVVMSPACEPSEEASVRRAGKSILWRLDDAIRPDPWLARFQEGDGVFVAGEHALEHPRLVRDLPNLLRSKNGFLVLMEFVPDALLPGLAGAVPDRLIKGHLLPTREILSPQPRLWGTRLVRAVEERWVRLIVIRFSPALSLTENLNFQQSVMDELVQKGFTPGLPRMFERWPVKCSSPVRLKMALLISCLVPLALLAWAARSALPPFLIFLAVSAFTIVAGVVIHGLGATPPAVLGLDVMRGVKLQLALPLFLAAAILLSPQEIRRLFEIQLRVKHLVIAVISLGVLMGVYLMRSGNFPLLAVSDNERYFRNWLDHILIARPRFKEFLIGHPLFLIGLTLKNKGERFQTAARFLLWIGLIGQISILNTFTHFHSPFSLGLIRTLNGLWIGCLVALPAHLLIHCRQ